MNKANVFSTFQKTICSCCKNTSKNAFYEKNCFLSSDKKNFFLALQQGSQTQIDQWYTFQIKDAPQATVNSKSS
jgi:hypothetical protein